MHAVISRLKVANYPVFMKAVRVVSLFVLSPRIDGRNDTSRFRSAANDNGADIAFDAFADSENGVAEQLVHLKRGHEVVAQIVDERQLGGTLFGFNIKARVFNRNAQLIADG